jgi:hypothetical protein
MAPVYAIWAARNHSDVAKMAFSLMRECIQGHRDTQEDQAKSWHSEYPLHVSDLRINVIILVNVAI